MREVLQRTRQMALAAYAHQDLPFDQVVEAVNPPSGRCPAIRCLTLLRTFANKCRKDHVIDTGPDGDTTLRACWSRHLMPRKPIHRSLFACGDGNKGHVIYRTAKERATAQRFADWLVRVVEAFADRLVQLLREVEMVSAQARRRIFGPVRWWGCRKYPGVLLGRRT